MKLLFPLLLLLSACSGSTNPVGPSNSNVVIIATDSDSWTSNSVRRVRDPEAKVTCWFVGGGHGGISCLRDER